MNNDHTRKMRKFASKAIARREVDRELAKAFNLQPGKIVEGMAVPRVFARFPHLKERLADGVMAKPLLMLVDLSPFSKVASSLSAMQIAGFLDEYYSAVVGLIEAGGGVVEKYIGDAVVAVFGDPFAATDKNLVYEVVELSKRIICQAGRWFEGEVSAKVAIAYGDCFLGYVGPNEHKELTIVGNPLTTLFRLEAECEPNQIIMLSSLLDKRPEHRVKNLVRRGPASWSPKTRMLILRGVDSNALSVTTLTWRGEL